MKGGKGVSGEPGAVPAATSDPGGEYIGSKDTEAGPIGAADTSSHSASRGGASDKSASTSFTTHQDCVAAKEDVTGGSLIGAESVQGSDLSSNKCDRWQSAGGDRQPSCSALGGGLSELSSTSGGNQSEEGRQEFVDSEGMAGRGTGSGYELLPGAESAVDMGALESKRCPGGRLPDWEAHTAYESLPGGHSPHYERLPGGADPSFHEEDASWRPLPSSALASSSDPYSHECIPPLPPLDEDELEPEECRICKEEGADSWGASLSREQEKAEEEEEDKKRGAGAWGSTWAREKERRRARARERVLLRPCECGGSMARVHLGCLQRWIESRRMESIEADELVCEVCRAPYRLRVREQLDLSWKRLCSCASLSFYAEFVTILITLISMVALFFLFSTDDDDEADGDILEMGVSIIVAVTVIVLGLFTLLKVLARWRRAISVPLISPTPASSPRSSQQV
eukprot:jgi/Mesen1/2283/ME000154S01456